MVKNHFTLVTNYDYFFLNNFLIFSEFSEIYAVTDFLDIKYRMILLIRFHQTLGIQNISVWRVFVRREKPKSLWYLNVNEFICETFQFINIYFKISIKIQIIFCEPINL